MQHLQQKKKSNESFQDITQESSTAESAECFSNNNTFASFNNLALSLTLNDGSNSAGQQYPFSFFILFDLVF
jgi:hypothetical protein